MLREFALHVPLYMLYLVPTARCLLLSMSGAVDRERIALALKCPKFSNHTEIRILDPDGLSIIAGRPFTALALVWLALVNSRTCIPMRLNGLSPHPIA